MFEAGMFIALLGVGVYWCAMALRLMTDRALPLRTTVKYTY